jgi:hypothetical protein
MYSYVSIAATLSSHASIMGDVLDNMILLKKIIERDSQLQIKLFEGRFNIRKDTHLAALHRFALFPILNTSAAGKPIETDRLITKAAELYDDARAFATGDRLSLSDESDREYLLTWAGIALGMDADGEPGSQRVKAALAAMSRIADAAGRMSRTLDRRTRMATRISYADVIGREGGLVLYGQLTPDELAAAFRVAERADVVLKSIVGQAAGANTIADLPYRNYLFRAVEDARQAGDAEKAVTILERVKALKEKLFAGRATGVGSRELETLYTLARNDSLFAGRSAADAADLIARTKTLVEGALGGTADIAASQDSLDIVIYFVRMADRAGRPQTEDLLKRARESKAVLQKLTGIALKPLGEASIDEDFEAFFASASKLSGLTAQDLELASDVQDMLGSLYDQAELPITSEANEKAVFRCSLSRSLSPPSREPVI